MTTFVPVALAAVLAILGLIHVYWAVTGSVSGRGVIPESSGKPLFTPSRSATLAVALALFFGAFLAVSRGGLFQPARPGSITHWLCIVAGVVFCLRAVGDFKYVGFFKRHRGTRFATLDTWFFSPLCVVVGASFLFIATLP